MNASSAVPYDRAVLAEVVVYHHKVRIEGCLCGWSEVGQSIGQHVADVYEACAAARASSGPSTPGGAA